MTREEIKNTPGLVDFMLDQCVLADPRAKVHKRLEEVCDLAIKALEQEPCEDVAKERYEDLCEYFGEAKDILTNREDFKAWLGRVKWHIHKAEELSAENDDLRDQLAMRDRFQKQEPCKVSEYDKDHIWYKGNQYISLRRFLEVKAEKEPCKDTISRQAALDCLTATKLKKFDFILHAREEIKKLPPVTPQQKIGRWIYGEDNSGTGRDGWYCNQCGHFEFWDYSSDMKSAELNLPNLCPNCKTKMQEDKDKKLRLRTKGEKEAYLDGFEMCAECIESYLKPDVRQYLRHLLVVVKKSLKIEDIEPQESEG